MDKFVVLCRGDLNQAELEVFGTFAKYDDAQEYLLSDDCKGCPNDHVIYPVNETGYVKNRAAKKD